MRNLNFLFSNSVQGESDLTRYCPRDAFEMPLTCPRHLFHKVLILSMLLIAIGVGCAWGAATSGTFYKITATGNLTTGYYIIAASNNANANSDYVAGNSINSNKRLEGVDINLSTSATTITNPDDALVFLITKTTVDKVDYYTFLNVKNNKYLYQSSTTGGKGMAWGDDATNFTLTGYNSSSPGGFKFTLNGASNNIFKYNASNHWFANYSGAYAVDMTPVRLFKAYKVTYNGNGNTGGTAPTDAVYYSGNGTTSVTTKTNSGSLEKTGYTFSCWNTQADGNGTDITPGNTFTITANTTLYAKWVSAGTSVSLSQAGQTNGTFLWSKGKSLVRTFI